MTGASLALIVLLGQVPETDPYELAGQLGSARYAEREAASAALQKLGARALPALRAARDQRDPEVRTRAGALVGRIEGALLTQASQVTLDFENVALAEALGSFSEQTGITLKLQPDPLPAFKGRKVTLHESGPLPFWKAIDRLCDAAQLQYNYAMHPMANGRRAAFLLFDGGARPAAPVSDSGPFRVTITSLHYQRNVSFLPTEQRRRLAQNPVDLKRVEPTFNEQFYAQLQVAGEPRLSLIQTGPMRITEALDDKGNSLIIPSAVGSDLRRSGYFGYATGSVIHLQAALSRPTRPGSTLKKLRGVVPVMVSTRKPNPLVVPIAGASGRTFQNDDVTLTVNDTRLRADQRPPSLDVTIRPNAANGNPTAIPAGSNAGEVIRPDTHQQQLEVTDAQGRPLPWFQSSFDAEEGRFTVSLAAPDQAASAAELHYYCLVKAATEVNFEFSEIPLPLP